MIVFSTLQTVTLILNAFNNFNNKFKNTAEKEENNKLNVPDSTLI